MQTKLDPEGMRSLARRLCGEAQFKADPLNAILAAVRWIDEVIGNEEGQESSRPLDAEIQQLAGIVRARGASVVAAELKASVGAVKSWVEGFYSPSVTSMQKIRAFIAKATESPSPTNAPGAEQAAAAKSGELFAADKQ